MSYGILNDGGYNTVLSGFIDIKNYYIVMIKYPWTKKCRKLQRKWDCFKVHNKINILRSTKIKPEQRVCIPDLSCLNQGDIVIKYGCGLELQFFIYGGSYSST